MDMKQKDENSKGNISIVQKYRAWFPRLLLLWSMVMAIIGSRVYCWFEAENKKIREDDLLNMCNQRARILQDQFNVSVNDVHTLAILISTFHLLKNSSAIDQETFADYTGRTAFVRPLMSGVAYAERVVNSERREFEKIHGWTIKTMERENSPVRDEYAPVIFSQETVSYIESIDMMSGEEDRENILKAMATGKAVLTRPFRLLKSNHLGVVLTLPVYKSMLRPDPTIHERVEATAGYLGGAFDVESLVERLLGQFAGNEDIVVNVYDVTNKSEPLIMYGSDVADCDASVSHTSMLDFGDPYRRHQMQCRYLYKAQMAWEALVSSFLSIIIGLLPGFIAYRAVMHVVKVEDDFQKMKELKVQAEAADVAKLQFLGTVTHEFRTPMNGILGMLSLLLDTELSMTQKDYSQTAQAYGKTLITLIDEDLHREKIESGKLQLETVPFDIWSIIDDVLTFFLIKHV